MRQHSIELSVEQSENIDSSSVGTEEKQLSIEKPVSHQAQQAWEDLKTVLCLHYYFDNALRLLLLVSLWLLALINVNCLIQTPKQYIQM